MPGILLAGGLGGPASDVVSDPPEALALIGEKPI